MWNGDYLSAILRTLCFNANGNVHVADNRSWEGKKMHAESTHVDSSEHSWDLKMRAPCTTNNYQKTLFDVTYPLNGNVPKSLEGLQQPKAQNSWVLTSFSGSSWFPCRAPLHTCPHVYPNTVNISSHMKHLPPPFYSLFSLFIFKISNNLVIWYSRISHTKQQRTFMKEKKEHGKRGVSHNLFFIREPLIKWFSAEPLPHALPGINQRHTWHQGNLQGIGSSQPPGREIWNDRSWEVGQRLYICCTSNNTS